MQVSSVDEVFGGLGAQIEQRFHDVNYNGFEFPAIAGELFEQAQLHRCLKREEIVRWALTTRAFPAQLDDDVKFGQPPLTVYRGRDFALDVYFWREFSPEIHNHGFAGVFTVLEGHSLHARYSFEPNERISHHFFVGEVASDGNELLFPGDVRAFSPAQILIHRLLHCDRPSISVVARTVGLLGPYYQYAPPHMQYDPRYRDPAVARHIELLKTLSETQSPEFLPRLTDYISSADYETLYMLLELIWRPHDNRAYERLVEKATERHGAKTKLLGPTYAETNRTIGFVEMRARAARPDDRFVFSAMLIATGRDDMMRLIRKRYPEQDPRHVALAWASSVEPQLRGPEFKHMYDGPLGREWSTCLQHVLGLAPAERVNDSVMTRIAQSLLFDRLLM
jgi:hypothetical protein